MLTIAITSPRIMAGQLISTACSVIIRNANVQCVSCASFGGGGSGGPDICVGGGAWPPCPPPS